MGWFSFFSRKRKMVDYLKFAVSSEGKSNIYELVMGMREIKINSAQRCKIDKVKETLPDFLAKLGNIRNDAIDLGFSLLLEKKTNQAVNVKRFQRSRVASGQIDQSIDRFVQENAIQQQFSLHKKSQNKGDTTSSSLSTSTRDSRSKRELCFAQLFRIMLSVA